MTSNADFISLGKYSDTLIQYFVENLPSSSTITNLVLDEETRRFFDILPYIEILYKLIQSKFTDTSLFSDLTKILTFFEKRQKEGELPVIIPQGLDRTNENDLEWAISAIRFHLIEEMKEFLRLITIISIPWDQILRKGMETSSGKIKKYVESLLDQFIITPSLELKNAMKTQIIDLVFSEPIQEVIADFLPSIFGLKSTNFLLNSYAQNFDLLVSFFTRPTTESDQITISKRSARETINRTKSKYPEFSQPLDKLDPDLRNAIAHRTYHLDEITEELVYKFYKWDKNTNETIVRTGKIKIKELHSLVIQTKIITINFLTGMFFYFLGWVGEQLGPQTVITKLLYPQLKTDFISRLIRMPFDDLLLSNKMYKEGKFLESSLFSFKMILLSEKTHFPQKGKEGPQPKSEVIKTMWEEILKLGTEKINGDIVFGYILYLIGLYEAEIEISQIASVVKSFITHYKEHNIEDESSFVIIEEVAEIINIFYPDSIETFVLTLDLEYKEDMFSFGLKDDYISRIRKQVLVRYGKVQNRVNEIIINTKDSLNELMMEKKDLQVIVTLLIAISESKNGELTGSEAARIIREKEENWPLSVFSKVKTCFMDAENRGYIQIVPHLADIKGKLTQKGYFLVNLLKTESQPQES